MAQLALTIVLTLFIGCGTIEEVNVDADNIEDEEESEGAEADDRNDKAGPNSEKVETRRGSHTAKKAAEPKFDSFELQNETGLTTAFISPDYCSGVSFRACRVRSTLLRRFNDGSYEINIEFWDDFTDQQFFIHKEKFEKDVAILLIDDANIATDNSFSYRLLWAVVRIEDDGLYLEIVYDYIGAGPADQGTEILDTFEFVSADS